MSSGDRLVGSGACSWCSHDPHPDGRCPMAVEYWTAPAHWAKPVPQREQCRCQKATS